MSLSAINPLGLTTPANNRIGRAVEIGGRLVRAAYKRLGELQEEGRPRPPKRPKFTRKKKRMPKNGGYGQGFFKGGFAPLVRTTPKIDDIVMTKGAGTTGEYHGYCQGTEIVWIGASTCNITTISFQVAKSILRKLLKQAGIHITNSQVPLINSVTPGVGSSSTGFILITYKVNGAGTPSDSTYTFVDPETLDTLTTNCSLANQITNYANTLNDSIPNVLRLFQYDRNTGGGGVDSAKLVATLNLKNEMVHLYSSVKLVIQNRTKGATGTTDNLDVIDAQPLKGKMYYFKKGNPEVREMPGTTLIPNTTSLLSRWPDNTVKLLSDTSAGYDQQLLNPPSPQFFNNCSKSAVISLEPGDLKEVNISNLTEKYFVEFVRSLAWFNGNTGARRQKVGDCILVALEERLNSGSANPIKVQYEAEHSVSCYVTTNKVDPLVKSFFTEVLNHA